MTNKLLVVAHPDDEMIFAGSFLQHTDGCKVICVTNGSNIVRRKEFQKVMKKVGVESSEIWDYPDEWQGDFDRVKLKEDIIKELSLNKYEMVITHNPQGEYGHTQHIALSEIMSGLVQKNLYYFNKGKRLSFWKRIKKWMILFYYKSERKVILSKEVREYILSETLMKGTGIS